MGAAAAVAISGACAFALACGFSLWRAYESWTRSRRHKASISVEEGGALVGRARSVWDRQVAYIERLSRDLSFAKAKRLAPKALRAGKGFDAMALKAGLEGKVTPDAFVEAKVRMAAAFAAAGLAFGALFSVQLAFLLLVVGAACGFQMPGSAMRTRVKERACEAERHLPEMLDVVALGMRSGLPFDSSLHIYASHFDTLLSRELESARVQWSSGLVRRDEALRKLASTYDSAVLARVVETAVKSIRYGSSMVSSLESDAAEARAAYQSAREERIAKAPVKMMVPTGVLILPAMLIMVLGPVLLELVQGGF